MDFLYTIDPNADEPIMLIDRHIGMDEEEGEGIMGDKFCRELMFLDTLNKSKINVWINSPGGVITDSDQIVSAILKSNTKVDTHNIGLCASCAVAILLSGKNRYMMDYAKLMIHAVSGTTDSAANKAFTDGILTNLTTRCKLDEATAKKFMSTETWLNADQCQYYGIAVKEPSSEYNRPRKPVSDSVNAWKDLSSIVNKLINEKKPHNMSQKITNRLKLVEGADESQQLAAIDAIENRASLAENKLQTQEAEHKTKIDALNSQLATLKTEKENADKKIKEFEDAKVEADKVKNKAEISTLISEGVKLGKIENKQESIAAFTSKVENMKKEDVKSILDAIPSKVEGATFQFEPGKNTYTVADINARLTKEAEKRKNQYN